MSAHNGYQHGHSARKIERAELNEAKDKKYSCLTLKCEDGRSLDVPLVWLRDHDHSRKYYDYETNLRALHPSNLFGMSHLKSFDFDAQKQELKLSWEDGHKSEFLAEDILDWSVAKDPHFIHYTLWDKASLKDLPTVSNNNFNFEEFARLFLRYGLVFVTDVDYKDEKATKVLLTKVANIHTTFWGDFFIVSADEDDQQEKAKMQVAKDDTAYKNSELGLHTDGMYFDQCPGIQVFHCLKKATISGGESILVDGFNVAEKFKKAHPEYFKILSAFPIEHRYLEGHDIKEKVLASAPGLKLHARNLSPIINLEGDKLVQIRYKPYNRGPFRNLKFNDEKSAYETIKFYEAFEKWVQFMDAPENALKLLLQPGTVLFFDNFRVLHARTEFQGSRKLLACYLSRDTFLAKARPLMEDEIKLSI